MTLSASTRLQRRHYCYVTRMAATAGSVLTSHMLCCVAQNSTDICYRVHSKASLRGICGGHSYTELGFPPRNSVSPCQYGPSNVSHLYSFMSPTLHNLSKLQESLNKTLLPSSHSSSAIRRFRLASTIIYFSITAKYEL